jgi:hypothetical protein
LTTCCNEQVPDYCGPATPRSPCGSHGLGSSDFARHYFRNHGCFLFLQVLRWFTSLGSLDHPIYSDERTRCSYRVGSPIRTSPDHRLLASPRGFSQLATSFFAYLRQGIHTHALSSLTIKLTPNHRVSFYFMYLLALPRRRSYAGRFELVALYSAFTFTHPNSAPYGRGSDKRPFSLYSARQIFNCQRSILQTCYIYYETNPIPFPNSSGSFCQKRFGGPG